MLEVRFGFESILTCAPIFDVWISLKSLVTLASISKGCVPSVDMQAIAMHA